MRQRPDPAPTKVRRPAAHPDHVRRRTHLAGFLEREFAESVHRSPFDGAIGTRRHVALATVELGPLHDAAKRLAGATLNDAVLSVVAGSLRRWIVHHHGSLGGVRVRVPVSLHHEGDAVANRDSFFSLHLPLNEADPVRRLEEVHAATETRKEDDDAEVREHLLTELRSVSPRLERFAERLESSPRSFAVSVSNVPGPRATRLDPRRARSARCTRSPRSAAATPSASPSSPSPATSTSASSPIPRSSTASRRWRPASRPRRRRSSRELGGEHLAHRHRLDAEPRASAVPRSLTIGTSSSSASSQVAKAVSPNSRRSQISDGAHEGERDVEGGSLPAGRARRSGGRSARR